MKERTQRVLAALGDGIAITYVSTAMAALVPWYARPANIGASLRLALLAALIGTAITVARMIREWSRPTAEHKEGDKPRQGAAP